MERRQFEFFMVRYVPDPVRAEFINIGIIMHEVGSDGDAAIVRITRNWNRVLCFDPDADTDMLEALEEDITRQFAQGGENVKMLLAAFDQQLSNGVQISEARATLVENLEVESEQLMTVYVEPRKTESLSGCGEPGRGE